MKQETVHDVLVLTLTEKHIDAGNAGALKERLLAALRPGQRAILDIQTVEFIDSSGLGALLSALRAVTSGGGDLKLAGATKPVRAILELVRFHRVLDVFNTREEALRAFAGR